jgi:transposase
LSEREAERELMSREEIRGMYAQGEEAVIALVEGLLEQIKKLGERIEVLESQASKTSGNSSKPPSGDGFVKRTKSLREKSEKKSGGQPGHPGRTLEWSEEVSAVVEHRVKQCDECGASLEQVPVEKILLRQVHDIPAIELKVTEHRAEVKVCPQCDQKSEGEFPSEASNLVQYGSRLKGMMVYLMEGQLLPSKRSCEVLKDLLGVEVSEGTIYNAREQCFQKLVPITQEIKDAVTGSSVVSFDETGLRVNRKLWWLHVACTSRLTYYFVHPKRGPAAMDEMGVLPEFKGKAIHDGWKSYSGYDCDHFLCNAHHLRELQFIWERYAQPWTIQMRLLLVTILRQVQELQSQGQRGLPPDQRQSFIARYRAVIDQGLAANPSLAPPPDSPKKRGRPKQSPPRNLLDRLLSQQDSVLGFMAHFDVPFDNNQAERDIRMMKLKQKISGSFRSSDGAKMFCSIRSYISTLRKQGFQLLDALDALFSDNPCPLMLQPE